MYTVKVTTVGNSLGVILPREVLARMGIEKGDSLVLLETPMGIELSGYDPEFAQQMEVFEKVLHAERQVLPRINKAALATANGALASGPLGSAFAPSATAPNADPQEAING
jgi:putative addiction module antidote